MPCLEQPPAYSYMNIMKRKSKTEEQINAEKIDFVGKFVEGQDITVWDVKHFEPKELAMLLTIVSKQMKKNADAKFVAENNLRSTLDYFEELDKRSISTVSQAHGEIAGFIKEMRK